MCMICGYKTQALHVEFQTQDLWKLRCEQRIQKQRLQQIQKLKRFKQHSCDKIQVPFYETLIVSSFINSILRLYKLRSIN